MTQATIIAIANMIMQLITLTIVPAILKYFYDKQKADQENRAKAVDSRTELVAVRVEQVKQALTTNTNENTKKLDNLTLATKANGTAIAENTALTQATAEKTAEVHAAIASLTADADKKGN